MKKSVIIAFFFVIACGALSAQSLDSLFLAAIDKEQLVDTTKQQAFDYYFFEGVKFTQHNQLDSAFICFQMCRSIDDKNAAVYFELSKILQFKKEPDRAVVYLQAAIDLAPENVHYREVQLAYFVTQKRFQEAIDGYLELLKRKPSSETYLYNLYELYGATKQPKKQIKTLHQIEALNGVNEDITFEKIRLLLDLKRLKAAEAEIQKLIQKFPRESLYAVLLGDFYRETGKEKKGVACYRQVLDNDSTDGYALTAMATYYSTQNQPEKANALMIKALNDKRLPVEIKLKWARSYIIELSQNEADEQISTLFSILFTLYPYEKELLKLHVDYLIHKQETASAIIQQRQLLDIDPMNEDEWQILMNLESDPYVAENSLKVTNDALVYFPLSPNWYYQKAVAHVNLEQFDAAYVTIDSALTFVGDIDKRIKGFFLALKADILSDQKNYKLALDCYEQSLEFDPANAMTQNNYAYFLALSNGDLRKAERLSSEAVKSNPKSATFLDTYAWVLFMRGDYKSAKFYQERAINLESSPILLEHYGDILFALGDSEAALKLWKESLELGNPSPVLKQKIELKQYISEQFIIE